MQSSLKQPLSVEHRGRKNLKSPPPPHPPHPNPLPQPQLIFQSFERLSFLRLEMECMGQNVVRCLTTRREQILPALMDGIYGNAENDAVLRSWYGNDTTRFSFFHNSWRSKSPVMIIIQCRPQKCGGRSRTFKKLLYDDKNNVYRPDWLTGRKTPSYLLLLHFDHGTTPFPCFTTRREQ